GSTDRPVEDSPQSFRQVGASGIYGYGAPGAKGRLEFDAAYFQRRYTDSQQAAAISDHNAGAVGGTFYWRIMPKTRLLFQGRYATFDYVDPSNPLDSSEKRAYIGAQWDATAKTSGFAKFGYMRKDFASSLQNAAGSSWDVGIRWSPRTYSVFDLSALKTFNESTGIGGAIISQRAGASWSHAWNSRLSHRLAYFNIRSKYVDSVLDRRDDAHDIGIKLNYQFRPWLSFGAEYIHTDRDSNVAEFRYKRNVIFLTIGARL
ncbi:MAG TPA: outer membrane beta-barrel protein, partial [Gammaproteobacteria bacterium]